MDDTQQSRVSDAAATRKRRSSILKSQRPARTPFSELEFNVATPTDTAKSRRVSFSRRTGVAEFITNEATTTWKNFYEEHNKSLESSSNDSEANASRQAVGHLGKRIFDQQFEEVEAVDFIGSLNPSNNNGSLNNVNFTQQLASLECTATGTVTAPQNKFELSTFTDQQSKIFGNDFSLPHVGEHSGRIDVNFSAMQQIGEKDDLDEIERDIERANNMGCHGPFSDRENMEYIEVDLNMTHVARNEEDMSITDTIHSPVQDVSKSSTLDKKNSITTDWATNKENIAIDPYAAPRESVNFALNDEPDQVLVFDGKRLIVQSEKSEKVKNYRQTLLPNASAETPLRKTIVLNVNDDLPNFVDDMLNSKCENSGFTAINDLKSSTMYNDEEVSMTLPVNRVDIVPKKKLLENTSNVSMTGNISMTQALPTNIINGSTNREDTSNKRRTIVFEESTGNISVTQSLPAKIITNKTTERRRTVVYEDDTGNISITQSVPTNILVNEATDKRKTIVFDEDRGNISVTQAISSNIILEERDKRKTIVFDDNAGDVSITQALPANIVLSDNQIQEKRRTIIYEDDTGNISVTQAIPSNVILSHKNDPTSERRRTVVYEDETGNISVTQALPTNILLEGLDVDKPRISEISSYPSSQSSPTNIVKNNETNKRRTILYENDTGNISVTQAIPTKLLPGFVDNQDEIPNNFDAPKELNITKDKGKTIVYDEADISMTEVVTADIIDEVTNLKRTTLFDNDDVPMMLAIKTNVFLLDKLDSAVDHSVKMQEEITEHNKSVVDYVAEQEVPIPTVDEVHEQRKTLVVHSEGCDVEMSISEALPKVQSIIQDTEKRKTVIFDNDTGNTSITKPIPAELLAFQNEIVNKSEEKPMDIVEQELSNCPDVIVYQASTHNTTKSPIRTDQGDRKSERPSNISSEDKVSSIKTDDVETSLADDINSADVSLLHPRVEEKSEQLDLKVSTITLEVATVEIPKDIVIKQSFVIDKPKEVVPKHSFVIDKPKDSVLNTLLDMSTITMDSGSADKNFMAQIEPLAEVPKDDTDNTSSESMFFITKDSEESEEAQTDKEVDLGKKSIDVPKVTDQSLLPLQYIEETPPIVDELQKKIAELKTAVKEESPIKKFYEKVVNSDLEGVVERDENVRLRQQSLNFKKANDTKELLDMISDFTDNRDDDDDVEPVVVKVRGRMALEDKSNVKSDVAESRRPSIVPNRLSIALNREDLLNNISMAQAALQKSRLVLDESDSVDEDTRDVSVDQMSSKKSIRTSNEVVKTLQFDDESLSESSQQSDVKISPLKKTAFGETSYMTESKSKVIPTYLKDVSDGIKELMLDLVKPMTDNMPFEGTGVDKGVRKAPSTHSTQIQANLITSSQVDIDSEVYSNPESAYDIDKMSSLTGGALNKSRPRTFRSPVKFSTNSSEKSSEFEVPSPTQRYLYSRAPVEPIPPRVLVFDHLNPLNNILLGTMDYTDAHKYNPKRSDETLCGSERSRSAVIHFDDTVKDNEYEVDKLTTHTQYRVEARSYALQGEVCTYRKNEDEHSMMSNCSKPVSMDQSVDAKIMDLKDNEMNTLIAMKGNKELLDASSSLTLVDDAIQPSDTESRTTSQDTPDEEMPQHKPKVSKSPVEIIYNIDEQGTGAENIEKLKSKDEELMQHAKICSKGKKRNYSPSRDKPIPSVDVTPKPISKLQKISNSSNVYRTSEQMAAEKDITDSDVPIEREKKKSPRKSKDKSPGGNVTVQQLITDFHRVSGISQTIDKQILDSINPKSESSMEPASNSDALECNSLEVISSFTSSKNLNAMKDVHSTSTTQSQQSAVQSRSKIDWHPELVSGISSNLTDSDSSVNVVAKIDMLPFMGSHECEWESSSGDTWTFRLLHGRLRLTARLAHRHDNATRTRVRGDTPVLDVTVETVQHDRKNPVATLCVRFACETMRYMVSRTCRATCYAADIPPLLRRCAAVARVALRWGRAMHDAKLHLAYTLDNDGYLTLKVANIPLRSVWEVSLRVELVVDDAREAPWPRAGDVRVHRVVSDVSVPDADVRRALAHTPRDWGHAPRTIWRMFRYLKHKTRDDDLLLGA